MRTGSILFLLGISGLLQLSKLPSTYILILLPICIVLTLRASCLRWPAWVAFGFLWALFRADLVLSDKLDRAIEGQPLIIEGKVVGLPTLRNTHIRFDFEVDQSFDDKGRHYSPPGKIRLSWYRSGRMLVPGEYWRLRVKLKRPYGFMNPGGLDYEAWLFHEGITSVGYVQAKGNNVRLYEHKGQYINRIRFKLRKKINDLSGNASLASLIPALTVGDRTAMTPDQWQVLTRTGTNHLLAISGLHIGFIAGLVFFITRWLWPLAGVYSLSIATPRIAAINAMLAATVYAAMAGFALPTQRALIMLVVVMVMICFYRRSRISNVLAIALLMVLLWDPFAIISPGFWLSFAAIVVIAYGMTFRIDKQGIWWRWGRVQWLIVIGLMPLLVLWFQKIPIFSLVANCVAVPWVSLLTVPLVLLASMLLMVNETIALSLLNLGIASLDLIWGFLQIIAIPRISTLPIPHPSLPALLAAIVGTGLLLMPQGLPHRWLGLLWIFPLLFPVLDKPAVGQFRLVLLDVGQGLAAIVQTSNHVLVYDTGPKYSDRFNAGGGVILPYLHHYGLNEVNILVQSHGDNDHIGGLKQLINELPVKRILTSVPEEITHHNMVFCHAGQSWEWDSVRFEILHPPVNSAFKGNNRSCVLRVSQKNHSILLTGDIEQLAERYMLHNYRKELKSTVVIAPHHGSKTSSSPAFIAAVDPEYVLFPTGYRNRFGFPKQDIIERYQAKGIKILNTARSGAITFRFEDEQINITEFRQHRRRFWHTVH